MKDLANPDPSARLRTVQMLKDAAYPEAAVPLAMVLTDPQDEVQFEAIAAEINIFLADRIVTRRRVGYLVEVRKQIVAEAAFASGPLVLSSRPVPLEVLTALRTAARDDHRGVGIEALYAFGALGVQPGGNARRELLRTSGPDLAAMIGAQDPPTRLAAVRVIGRLFERRPEDEAVEQMVGDAVITALNDNDRAVRSAAMQALGAMRYDRAVQALADLFKYYGKGEPAEAALDATARIGHASSVPLLTSQLTSKNAAMKAIAIEGLARVGDTARLTEIQSALGGERNDSVLLAGQFASAALSGGSIDPIVESLVKPRLRDQARQYVIELAAGRSSLFTRHVQDPDARVRMAIIDALGLAYDPGALPLVEAATRDADPQVARAAAGALARLRAASRTS